MALLTFLVNSLAVTLPYNISSGMPSLLMMNIDGVTTTGSVTA